MAADFLKHARTLSILTIVSRITGLGRDQVLGAAFGFQSIVMQAWGPAFALPNLFRNLFGEGALTSAFLPVYTRLVEKGEEEAARRLTCLAMTVLVVLLGTLTLLGEGVIWLINHLAHSGDPRFELTLGLSAVMFPYLITVCLVALMQGVLNVRGHFSAPALAPAILNVGMIGVCVAGHFLWPENEEQQAYMLAASVVALGLLNVVMQVPPLRRAGFRFKPVWDLASPHLREIALLMLPMIIALGVVQFNTYINQLLTQFFSPHPDPADPTRLVTTFDFLGRTIAYPLAATANPVMNYGQRLYQLPLGVFIIALGTAIFPALARHAANDDRPGLAETLNRGLRVVTVIALPCTAGLALCAVPLVRVLFEYGRYEPSNTPQVAMMTALYGLGILPFAVQHLVARAFFALQEPRVAVRSSMVAAGVNFVLNVTLIWFWGIEGLAVSTVVCAAGQSLWLVWMLRRRLGRLGLRRYLSTLWRAVLATLLMTAAAWGAMHVPDIFRLVQGTKAYSWTALGLAIVIGAGVYLGAAKMLRLEEFFEIMHLRRRA